MNDEDKTHLHGVVQQTLVPLFLDVESYINSQLRRATSTDLADALCAFRDTWLNYGAYPYRARIEKVMSVLHTSALPGAREAFAVLSYECGFSKTHTKFCERELIRMTVLGAIALSDTPTTDEAIDIVLLATNRAHTRDEIRSEIEVLRELGKLEFDAKLRLKVRA